MTNRTLFEQLDGVIQVAVSRAAGPNVGHDRRLAALAQLAGELRDLPRASFRARLKADLASAITEAAKETKSMATATATVHYMREGFHTITPYLLPAGADRQIQFLKQAFAAEEILRVPRPDGTLVHTQLRIGDSMIELADPQPPFHSMPSAIHLYVTDADAVYRSALEAGAGSLHPLTDQPYGDREGSVQDPLGNHWYIATHKATGLAPEGLRTITPYLHPKGADRVLDFLQKAFGAEMLMRAQSSAGVIQHAAVRIGDSVLEMGEAHGKWQPMPCALHLYVEDTDVWYHRAIDAGATTIYGPADQPYGDRGAGLLDPFGNHWYLATRIR